MNKNISENNFQLGPDSAEKSIVVAMSGSEYLCFSAPAVYRAVRKLKNMSKGCLPDLKPAVSFANTISIYLLENAAR